MAGGNMMFDDEREKGGESSFFKMKPAGGPDKIGNLTIEVPDDGTIAPIARFELTVGLETGMNEEEVQKFLEEKMKTVKPQRVEINTMIDVSPDNSTTVFSVYLVWAPDRGEWVGITCTYWPNAGQWSNDFLYDGPFKLDDKYKRVILQVYNLTDNDMPLSKVAFTEPAQLVLASKKAAAKAEEVEAK